MTSPSHPPLPATRFVPQPSVSRADRSEQRPIVLRDVQGGRETQASCAAAASAAETTNLASSQRDPEMKAPRATSIASMAGLSC